MSKTYKSFVKEYAMGLQVPATSYLKPIGSLTPLRKKESVKKNSENKEEDIIPIPSLINARPLKKRETFKNKMSVMRIDQKEK